MLNLTIDRRWKKDDYTIGRFLLNGEYLFNSLEDTDRKLRKSDSLAVIRGRKIYGKTAIPAGTYTVKLSVSPKFAQKAWAKKYKGLVPEICGVPGFDGVRIHPGNTPADTLGCPLVGKNTKKGQLTSSTVCYYRLMDELILAQERNEEIQITII